TNILYSLGCAAAELDDEIVFSYSDIVFHPDVVGRLLATPGAAALVVDRQWAKSYEGRTEHPIGEAELARVDAQDRVIRVGKRAVPPSEAAGEFIGLARFTAPVARLIRDEYRRLAGSAAEGAFGDAPRFAVAYLTDMLNHLVTTQALEMRPCYIDGMWRE